MVNQVAARIDLVDSVVDHLDEIIANQVDITNQALAGDTNALGTGPGPEASPVSVSSVDGNNESRFDLFVRHQGAGPDRYRLAAYSSPAGAALPDGWQVRFIDPVSGASLQHIGSLASGASRHIQAIVTVPANSHPATTSVYFGALSTLTGARGSQARCGEYRNGEHDPHRTGPVGADPAGRQRGLSAYRQ